MRPLLRWIPAVGLMVALWVLSDRPGDALPELGSDALAHVAAWAALGFALRWAAGRRSGRWASWVAWGIAVAYGLVDEVHQSFVPGRTPSAEDLAADATGALLGVAVAARYGMRRKGTRS